MSQWKIQGISNTAKSGALPEYENRNRQGKDTCDIDLVSDVWGSLQFEYTGSLATSTAECI